jgi:hypothetical protein
MRKGDDNLKRSLDKVVVPVYCQTFVDAQQDKEEEQTQQGKLKQVREKS